MYNGTLKSTFGVTTIKILLLSIYKISFILDKTVTFNIQDIQYLIHP